MKIKHIYTDESGDKVIVTCTQHNCTEVVRKLFYFLQAISYNRDTVLDAFQNIVDEYREDDKQSD